ncbi:hypothetical protein Patl1_24104 [Pistacia atlantica]|uniref:Uncharacterized protein n=1 Tax=Pistacia atlantica TaxID=434234 RepID=A0ACC0ZW93_9ROSI|nr:hypothetical protein Patl1_24104 [Pistacia atlantica]
MASLITAATKVGHVRVAISRRSTWNPRLFVAAAPRYSMRMNQNAKKWLDRLGETAQDVSEKAKQTLEGPWGSAKDTAQKAKESLMGNAEASKETVKQHAEEVKKNMNMKN